MVEVNDMYTLLIRGEDLTEAEIGHLRKIDAELGREKLFQLVSRKKILPFAARTFAMYGIDAAFWAEQLELFRTRNRKILHCLNDAYTSLRRHGVRKMFVSENFGALLSANGDIGLFASGDVDNYADPCERERIYQAFDALGYRREERYSGQLQIAAEFFPPENMDVPEKFYVSVDFYPLARLKLPCFVQADRFVDWDGLTCYADTAIMLPPANALMYICMLHISLHSFSRAPDIRLYIDLLNMSKLPIDYAILRKWCMADQTCTRAATAAELANCLMKTHFPEELIRLSERRKKIERLVYDPKKNDLIYEPSGLKVLQIETLCDDRSILHGILSILFPDKHWMKKVYGSCGLRAHMKHFLKVL